MIIKKKVHFFTFFFFLLCSIMNYSGCLSSEIDSCTIPTWCVEEQLPYFRCFVDYDFCQMSSHFSHSACHCFFSLVSNLTRRNIKSFNLLILALEFCVFRLRKIKKKWSISIKKSGLFQSKKVGYFSFRLFSIWVDTRCSGILGEAFGRFAKQKF
jgi:hypothetical protein